VGKGKPSKAPERHAAGMRPRRVDRWDTREGNKICLELIGLDEAFLSIGKPLF
jgi:hypothetical protein